MRLIKFMKLITLAFDIRSEGSAECLYLWNEVVVKGKDFNECFTKFIVEVKKAKYKNVEIKGIRIL